MNVVEVRDLVKVYSGGVRALDGVSLSVGDGEVFAILGPNGAGKTTLIRILTTQLRPTSGAAYVLGHDVVSEAAEVRELIGYVPQEFSVWTDLTGYENLVIYSKLYGLPRDERGRAIGEVLDFMGLSEAANRLVKTYSGGMVRRLEVACALLRRPRVLFLDEPTVGLDPATRHVMWERLLELRKQGTTIVFTTHYMDEAQEYADRVALMSRGRVVRVGTVDELRRDVGRESVIVEVDNVARAAGTLKDLGWEAEAADGSLTVFVDDAEIALPEIVVALSSRGVRVRRAQAREVNLEDVFIKYVGAAESGDLRSARVARRAVKKA